MPAEAPSRRHGRVFDSVAKEYDRTRPTYPDELIDQACRVAGLRAGDRVLEIGCGTGQLTRSLLARGLDVTALEPGERLIALAQENLQDAGALELVNARFEDAPLPDGHFRAVFSAAAFHWLDPDRSWAKAARVLSRGGTLALVQYCGLQEPYSAADYQAALSALTRISPEVAADWPVYRDLDAISGGVEQRAENVSQAWAWVGGLDVEREYARALFDDVRVATAPTRFEHTAEEINALFRTNSAYHRLTPAQRHALEGEQIATQQRLGRPIRTSVAAVLVTARRAPSA